MPQAVARHKWRRGPGKLPLDEFWAWPLTRAQAIAIILTGSRESRPARAGEASHLTYFTGLTLPSTRDTAGRARSIVLGWRLNHV